MKKQYEYCPNLLIFCVFIGSMDPLGRCRSHWLVSGRFGGGVDVPLGTMSFPLARFGTPPGGCHFLTQGLFCVFGGVGNPPKLINSNIMNTSNSSTFLFYSNNMNHKIVYVFLRFVDSFWDTLDLRFDRFFITFFTKKVVLSESIFFTKL